MAKSREWTYRGTIRKVTERDIDAALMQGVYYGLSGLECQAAFVKAVDYLGWFRGSPMFLGMGYWLSSVDIDMPEKKAEHAMIAILTARLKNTDPDNEREWAYMEELNRRYLIKEI